METLKNITSRFCHFLGDLRHFGSKWTIAPLVASFVVYGLLCGSCGAIKPVPVETTTEVHYIDSTVLHIKDSVRIIEKSRWKDYGGLLDTLKIEGNRSRMTAYTDTTRNIINGSLEEDGFEEKERIVYRDRWKVRDSLVYQDRPYPVEVEKRVKFVPWYHKFLSALGLIALICFGVWLFFRLRFGKKINL